MNPNDPNRPWTSADFEAERRYIFEERLALLGAGPIPTTDQHNMAGIEADAHIAALKRELGQDRKARSSEGLRALTALRDSL